MTAVVVSEDIPPHFDTHLLISRLADEGVPIAVIGRSLLVPSEMIRRAVQEGIDEGGLVEMPGTDWPPGSQRSSRGYPLESILAHEELLKYACCRTFKTTNLQSAMLAVLLRRDEVTKEQLHAVIERNRVDGNRSETDLKMVDVIICHIRKKVTKNFGITIKTLWGRGYTIEHKDRDLAVTYLDGVNAQAGAVSGALAEAA